MNEEEIKAMNPSRELDILIMSKMFKYTIKNISNEDYVCFCDNAEIAFPYVQIENKKIINLPHFSTDKKDAEYIRIFLKDKGYKFSLTSGNKNYICVIEEGKTAYGKTKEEALCKSYLLLGNKKNWQV